MRLFVILMTVLSILLVSPCGVWAQSDTVSVDPYTAELISMVHEQQKFLESEYSVTFTNPVNAHFSFPDGTEYKDVRFQQAWYIPGDGEIRVQPVYKYMIGYNGTRESLLPVIRHELAHALAHQMSIRLGQGQWPPVSEVIPEYLSEGSDVLIGYAMLSEGIARVFERFGEDTTYNCDFDNYDPGENVYIPKKMDDLSWKYSGMLTGIIYEGGYCLAKPILEIDTQKGIEYMITHQLVFPDWNPRRAIRAYTSDALKSISH